MTRWRAALVAAVALPLVLLAAPAHAHNELVRVSPADGTTVQDLPRTARFEFAETVRPADLKVSVDGTRRPVSATRDPRALTVDLSTIAAARTVVLSWSVVDEHDGHRSGGTLTLHVRTTRGTVVSPQATTRAAVPPDREPTALRVLSSTSRLAGYLAMTVLLGGLLFVAVLWPEGAADRRTRAVLATSVGAGLLASVGSVVVVLWRGADQPLRETLATDYGRAGSALVLLWLLATVVVAAVLQVDHQRLRGVAWRVAALVVAGGMIRVAGLNAHATQGAHAALGITADFLHLTAVSAWVGGLVVLCLCVLPRGDVDELEHVVLRFSRVALVSVAAIVASGLLLLWEVSRGIEAFWSTHYARVLIVKLALFALVMLAAMKSKRWVETAVAATADRRPSVRSFAISVAAETTLVAAVLGAASVLVTSSPGV